MGCSPYPHVIIFIIISSSSPITSTRALVLLQHALSPPRFLAPTQLIERVRGGGGRTLLHCHQGVSRSGAFALAYLMWAFDLSVEAALVQARSCRSVVSPNPGFLAQLLEWQRALEAGSALVALKPALGMSQASGEPRALFFAVTPLTAAHWMSTELQGLVGHASPVSTAASSGRCPISHGLQLVRTEGGRAPLVSSAVPMHPCGCTLVCLEPQSPQAGATVITSVVCLAPGTLADGAPVRVRR